MPRKKSLLFLLLAIFSLLIVAGCGGALPLPAGDEPTATVAPTETPTLTPEPTPTLTPTPLPPLLVILISPDTDPELANYLQTTFGELAREAGLRMQVREGISAGEVASDVAYLIAAPPANGLSTLVASAPDTRFLAIDIPGLTPAPNLISIGGGGTSLDQQGFIAGYTAAILTDQWRVGVISVEDTDTGQTARIGFQTGVPYFCGLCNPENPPFYDYPLFIGLPAGSTDVEWRALADFMVQRFVQTVYVVPGAGGDDLLRYLADNGVNIIGSTQPPDAIRSRWIMSIRPEIRENYTRYWPDLIGEQPGFSLPIPILLTDINPELMSTGRQAHIEQVFEEVQAGYIYTGVDDITP